MPSGRVLLEAHSQLATWIAGPAVDLVVGGEVEAESVYDGPDTSRRVVGGGSCGNRGFANVLAKSPGQWFRKVA